MVNENAGHKCCVLKPSVIENAAVEETTKRSMNKI